MNNTSGNVLFLILIAVALFAALTYAVGSSSRTGAGTAQAEKYELKLNQLQSIAASMMQGIQRVRVGNSCDATEISFEADGFTGGPNPYGVLNTPYTNPSAPLDKRCHVFAPEGGGAVSPGRIGVFAPSGNNSRVQIRYAVNFQQIGSSAPEIYMLVFGVGNDFCTYINNKNGISGIPLIAAHISSVQFLGDYSTNVGSTFGGAPLDGKTWYCYNNFSPNQNAYVQALVER